VILSKGKGFGRGFTRMNADKRRSTRIKSVPDYLRYSAIAEKRSTDYTDFHRLLIL
jgi:hypothetical protein